MDAQANKQSERWTIRRLLQTTSEYLGRHGSGSPRLDAELLLGKALRCSRVDLYVNMEKPLLPQELDDYREYVRRRGTGEPVAYILGQKEFFGLPFQVAPGVLVPRPDTETLVEAALQALGPDTPARVLDIGTGSGAIALSIAHNRKNVKVTATDVSPEALAIARENAKSLGLEGRVEFREGALFNPLKAGETFDVIVSNPPYIPDAEVETLPEEIRLHEPRVALAGGAEGLDLISVIVREAPRWLVPGGLLGIEMGAGQAETAYALAEKTGTWKRLEIRPDLAGIDRVLLARRRSN